MTDCPYLEDGRCTFVEKLLSHNPVVTSIQTCHACESTDRPRRLNLVTLSLATRTSERESIYFDSLKAAKTIESKGGFGSRLESYFGVFFTKSPGCKCDGHKDILDTWTPTHIRMNMDSVVSWLESEARTRHLPFSRVLARKILTFLVLQET